MNTTLKNLFLPLALVFFLFQNQYAQILTPVEWNWSKEELENGEIKLTFEAEIDPGWNIYSQFVDPDGPIPTSFNFEDSSSIEFLSSTSEESKKTKEGFDPFFEMEVKKFGEHATFVQRLKLKNPNTQLKGYLEFMACDAEQCLPPERVDFSFSEDKGMLDTGMDIDQADNGILDPVDWRYEVDELGGGEYMLNFIAEIDEGWSVYSQFADPDGPVPTSFTFADSTGAEFIGEVEETGAHVKEGIDPVFELFVKKFTVDATFSQKVKLASADQEVHGYLEFMTCDHEKCLPPEYVDFVINVGTKSGTLPNLVETTEIPAEAASIEGLELPESAKTPIIADCGLEGILETEEGKGLLNILFLGFLGGLVALLTPCVFPMIPLTVSFFTKRSTDRKKGLSNAFFYGFSILAVYLLLSVPFHLLDTLNPDILNEVSTNIYLNIFFFLIFIFFAFSFFGYYELQIPSSWTNKVSSAEDAGGYIGVFFMALTLALVSFSCTGPILGSLLAGALTKDGGAWQLTAGMGGFGFALALPFAVFAAFPGWLNSLPKSGGWLNSVKVVLGFLELALAFKFLSNADLVEHWGLLKIEVFLGLWILTGIGLALYLFGLIKFPHDSPNVKLGGVRVTTAVLTVSFVIYLASGFRPNEDTGTFTSLKWLSGLAPPVGYSWIYPNDCPHNLTCFKDFDEGLAYAKKLNKPMMVDFTGHACVNCRKMEEHVWPEDEVWKYLEDDYVVVSLYVDDKRLLSEEEQVTVEFNGNPRKLRTIGNKWSFFETINYNKNSQPYYVLLSPDLELLNKPVPYTPDVTQYSRFLECGLEAFKGKQGGITSSN